MPSLKLSNPFRRNADRPSLKDRAATLKATAARVLRREPAEADQGRRTLMKGSLAAAVAVPLPVFASPAVLASGPHPDQALLDAEAAHLKAKSEDEALSKAYGEARRAMRAALGPCPDELLLEDWEAAAFSSPWRGRLIRRLPTRLVHHDDRLNPAPAWTGEGLRQAIALAPGAFGRAGQTPHLIRRWRELLPIAEAHDARCDALDRRFRCKKLSAQSRAAQKAMYEAAARLHRMPPATTVEGLAVHTRALASTVWYDGNTPYTALLLSAAAITGVALRQSDFNVAGWAEAWRAVGGRIDWRGEREGWAFISPSLQDASLATTAEVRRLNDERSSNSAVIGRWLHEGRGRG